MLNHKKKNISKEMNKAIPNDIKVLFGKFYLFSVIYLIFFLIIYPFILVKIVTRLSSIILFCLLTVFYVYMIVDVQRNKKTYNSIFYVILITLVFMAISFSIIKFFI